MSEPYHIDGEFFVFAHIFDTPFSLTKVPSAAKGGNSVVCVYETLPHISVSALRENTRRNVAFDLLETNDGLGRSVAIAGENHPLHVFAANGGEDLWYRIRGIERFVNIPATAIPIPFADISTFAEKYPMIREELRQTEGRVHETRLYRDALNSAIAKVLTADDVQEAQKAWISLRRYFPVNRTCRYAVGLQINKTKRHFVESVELVELLNRIKQG